MRYPPDLLDDIRARVSVSEVVGRKVKLKRAGREHIGLSPFKSERTPSFSVNDRKGFYHCFATGEHGDIFTFLMKTEGLTFPEAIERLANEAGVTLPQATIPDHGQVEHETRVRDVLEATCRFFQTALGSQQAEEARHYLKQRGISQSEINLFRIGYAPSSKSALKSYLIEQGYNNAALEDAGVVIFGEDIQVSYDRFRNRIIFPIADVKKRIIGFGGRSLSKEQQPKYLNSPESLLFHKGRTLFNIAAAREATRMTQSVIVAEGYMDVIALNRAGFVESVAPLGTALTEDQLKLLWHMSGTPTLCFDGDEAGKKAAYRALDEALPYLEPSRSLQFVFLPQGQDPDDIVTKKGVDALKEMIAKPKPLFDVLWERELKVHPLDTPEQRASFEGRVNELANKIADKSLRFHYTSTIRERLRIVLKPVGKGHVSVREHWRSRAANSHQVQVKGQYKRFGAGSFEQQDFRSRTLLGSAIVQSTTEETSIREVLIVWALLQHPWLIDDFAEDIAVLPFQDPKCRSLCDLILSIHHQNSSVDSASLKTELSALSSAHLFENVQKYLTHNADKTFEAETEKNIVIAGWNDMILLHHKRRLHAPDIVEAEKDYIDDQTDENSARLCVIKRQF